MCAHMHPCSELEADAVRRTGGADPGLFMIRNVLLLLPVHCLYGCKRGETPKSTHVLLKGESGMLLERV